MKPVPKHIEQRHLDDDLPEFNIEFAYDLFKTYTELAVTNGMWVEVDKICNEMSSKWDDRKILEDNVRFYLSEYGYKHIFEGKGEGDEFYVGCVGSKVRLSTKSKIITVQKFMKLIEVKCLPSIKPNSLTGKR